MQAWKLESRTAFLKTKWCATRQKVPPGVLGELRAITAIRQARVIEIHLMDEPRARCFRGGTVGRKNQLVSEWSFLRFFEGNETL